MSFIDPSADPTGLGGRLSGNTGLPPIVQTLPATTKSFANRYTPANVKLLRQSFSGPIVDSFLKFEARRAQSGQYPLTPDQAVQVLQSAQTRHAATAAPDRNPLDILGNVASDVGDIVTSLPRMPQQIAEDILHGGKTLDAIQSGNIDDILQAPIVRLLPGAYTAHNLLSGDFNEIASHPVMTALDVLPYATHFGAGEALGKVTVPGTDTTIAEFKGRASDAFGRTLPGQFVKNAWGKDVREMAAQGATRAAVAQERMNPAMGFIHEDNLSKMAQEDAPRVANINKVLDVDPERLSAIRNAWETGSLGDLDLTDAERGALAQVKMHNDAFERYGLDAGTIAARNDAYGTREIYTPEQAAKIDTYRQKLAQRETFTNLRSAITDPATLDLDALTKQVADVQNSAATMKVKRDAMYGLVHALDKAGYDTGAMLRDVSKATAETMPTVQSVVDAAQGPVEGSVRVRRRTGNPALDSADRWLERHRSYTPKTLETARARSTVLETRVLPARWTPLFQEIKLDRAKGLIEDRYAPDDPALPDALARVHNHIFSDFSKAELNKIDAEVIGQVGVLRSQGLDPQFIHRVSPEQARAMNSPSISTVIPRPSQYRLRVNDWTPHVDSFSVSLTHQALELIRQQEAAQYVKDVRDNFTTPLHNAAAELEPVAQRAAARSGRPVAEELERLLRKSYVRWDDAEAGFIARNAKRVNVTDTAFRPDDLLLPRHLARALDQMANPPTYSRIFDPITKVFRYSVLPLSPRFHVNNVVGGALMQALEEPRGLARVPEAMKTAAELHKMQTALQKGEFVTLSDAAQTVLKNLPERMRAELGSLAYSLAPDTEFKLLAGKQLGEIGERAGVARLVKGGMDRFKAAVDWSFRANETMDNAYRLAGFLDEFDRGMKKGMTAEEAGVAGLDMANKFMPRWLEMTPIERSVLRAVFPFYAFMSHIFRFASRYPIDHPWRTSVMAGLARAEMEDFGTGLPQTLASAFFLGSPDSNGNQKVIDIGAANPFRDFGDNLTLAGFMGQTNPVFKTALRMLGYDPQSRSPNLYPEIEYDPDTGRFKQVNKSAGGLAGQFITDIIPQAQLIPALLGTSSEFKQLLRANPDSAQRMLLGSVGIPLVYKQVPLYEDAFKAELNRQEDARTVWSHALKTGDYSRAMRYPSLRPLIAQVQEAYSKGALNQFVPGSVPPASSSAPVTQPGQSMTQAELANA